MSLRDDVQAWQTVRRQAAQNQERKFAERRQPGQRIQTPFIAPPTYEEMAELGEFFGTESGEGAGQGIRAVERMINDEQRQALDRREREDHEYLTGDGAAKVARRMTVLMHEQDLSPREALLRAAREVRDGDG